MTVFDFFRKAEADAPQQKASAAGGVIAWQGSGRVAWSPRDTVSLTRTGFAGNPVGFRSVKMIAEAAAALPLVLQDSARRYEEHPAFGAFKAPQPSARARGASGGALWPAFADGRCLYRGCGRGDGHASRAACAAL